MGNSYDRRRERRLAERVAAILNPIQSKKPVDAWLQLVGIAVGLGFWLWPNKTPASVSIALGLMFLCFIHPVWNFWWIEDKRYRQAIASIFLCTLLVGYGILTWPSPLPGLIEEPVVHIEPERGILWSTNPGQKLGMFTVQLHNTGVPVDISKINLKYFIAQKSSGVIIKRLPDLTDPHKGLLEHDTGFPLSIDFNPYMDEIAEVSANLKEGPSLAGVYVATTYRRHSDGKDFSLSKSYGLLWVSYGDAQKPKGVALYTEGTHMDDAAPIQNSKLTLGEVSSFLPLPERWISITKYVGVGHDSKVATSSDRPMPHPPPKSDLTLKFVIKKNLSFMILNGDTPQAMNPRYSILMTNLDNPRNKTPDLNGIISLPNTTGVMNDYVRPNTALGPVSLGNLWQERGLLKPNDRMFGTASIGCPSCPNIHYYYVYAVHGQDGWYCESSTPLSYIAKTIVAIERGLDDPTNYCAESSRVAFEDIQ